MNAQRSVILRFWQWGQYWEDFIFSSSTLVRFASLFSGGFITAIVVNPPERKLAKRTFVCSGLTKAIRVN
jgi:hypothetical protein